MACATLALLGRVATPPTPRTAPDTLTTAYEVSGLRVVQRVTPASHVVAVRIYLLGGTRQLTEKTAGVEALMLKAAQYGTAQFPGDSTRRAMVRTGCVVESDANVDWTMFGFLGLDDEFDVAWRVLVDRLAYPTLSDSAVARARAQLLTATHRRYTQPDLRLRRLAIQSLFRDHSYAIDPEGTEASLRALTTADVRTYARDQLITSRMLLVVVGNVERAHVESLVTTSFGRLPRGHYRWTLPPPVPRHRAHWVIEDRHLPTTYLLGSFAGPPVSSDRYWAFQVATAVLGSRLSYVIRTQRSLSYNPGALFLDQAIPVGGAYASTPDPDQTTSLILAEVGAMWNSPAGPTGLGRWHTDFIFSYEAEKGTAAGQADLLARAELFLGGYQHAPDFFNHLRDVSAVQVRDIVGEYMRQMQFVYLGDTSRMRGHW